MSLPVVTGDQMRAWEAASWTLKASVQAVIGLVGERLAARIKALVPLGSRVLLLAGKGHNGDDLRAAAPLLKGLDSEIINVHDPVTALERVRTGLAKSPAWVIDGLFGIGLRGELSSSWKEILEMVNAARLPVMAVDIPSGLDAETGEPHGAAVYARLTVTIGVPKIGLFRTPALPFVGRVEVMSGIGLNPSFKLLSAPGGDASLSWTESRDFVGLMSPRLVSSNKGDFGHVVIIAGSQGYHGAAVLAARAATRARPGLVTILTSPEAYLPVACQMTGTMVAPWKENVGLPPKTSTVVVGPGLAGSEVPEWLRNWVRAEWSESPIPWVADASAMDWLRAVPPNPSALRVWTPHPGEAARLLDSTPADVQKDRLASARRLSQGIWTVLKGHQTLVCSSSGEIHINPTGNPGLAQGGTGDVLAGYIGGLLAQPALVAKPEVILRYAVWDHGAAADRLEPLPAPWTSDDLIHQLGLPLSVHPADALNPTPAIR